MTPKQIRNGVSGSTEGQNTAVPVVPSAQPEIASAMSTATSKASYQSATVTQGKVG
jgi:hypothetical protein